MSDLRLESRATKWGGMPAVHPTGGHLRGTMLEADARRGADLAFDSTGPTAPGTYLWPDANPNWFGSYALDDGLRSAVWLSLFTDRRAEESAELLDEKGGIPDRRGYWADFLSTLGADDAFGSRLWLLRGQTLTRQTRARARTYALESLAWLEELGLGKATVDVPTPRLEDEADRRGVLVLNVTISDDVAQSSRRFEFVWSAMIRVGV